MKEKNKKKMIKELMKRRKDEKELEIEVSF